MGSILCLNLNFVSSKLGLRILYQNSEEMLQEEADMFTLYLVDFTCSKLKL